jgi:hypothetical protein
MMVGCSALMCTPGVTVVSDAAKVVSAVIH